MIIAIIIIALLATAIGAVLVYSRNVFTPDELTAVDTINALLPQTQCAQCGYPGCRPYAEALVNADEAINLCPPGGKSTQEALGKLLGKTPANLTPSNPWAVAVIDEPDCIGCALCITACPVDAIIGANRFTHTIIEQECTGCELCIPACPVDCISMDNDRPGPFQLVAKQAQANR